MRALPVSLLAAILSLSLPAPAGPAQAPRSAPMPDPPRRHRWDLARFTRLDLVPTEAGAPQNDPPAPLDVGWLRQALGSIRFRTPEGVDPLFERSELEGLLMPVREALAVAAPGEDVQLLSAHQRGRGLMSPQLGVTARLFMQGGSLNIIVHDARLDFASREMAEGYTPTFHFGSRLKESRVKLEAQGGSSRRGDWLAFPMAVAAAPATVGPGPAPGPEVAPAPKGRSDFRDLEDRLRALKRLREENLISEEEYRQKRQELLKGL